MPNDAQDDLAREGAANAALAAENERLLAAIREHHAQVADDRCVPDDDKLYAAAGLPPADRRVGDKAAMLKNCEKFVERRCEEGGWASYADLQNLLREWLAFRRDGCLGPGVGPAGETCGCLYCRTRDALGLPPFAGEGGA